MKVSNFSILIKLLVSSSPYCALGEEAPLSSLNETSPHKGCLLMLKDREPPHKPLVGKAYEESTITNYKVENEAGAMAAECVNGLAGGYPCNNVNLLSMLPISDLDDHTGSANMANDIWGWTHAGTGREFALIELYTGTAFVEITDPINPVYKGGLRTQGNGSSWRDIKTYGNYAFIVSEESDHGMQVFDLTELLDPSSGPSYGNSARYTQIGSAHNIFINEDTGFAYIVGARDCNGGLHMVDISDETNPQFAGCFSDDDYTHDVQCVIYEGPDSDYSGREICFASNEDTITIVDVTNKSNPTQISRTGYQNDGYTHQGWLTEDHSYFIFNDEVDELSNSVPKTATHVMDVRDLDNVNYLGNHLGRTNAIDHNNYVKGEYLYQANYRAGFNVLKISDASNVEFEEAGFFDIYPESDSSNFNGAWSNYPYFPSGTIIVSGIEQGLFVLEFLGSGPPATAVPTASPVTTASPTIDCPSSTSLLEVFITTDNRPRQTSWSLYTDAGDIILQESYTQDDRSEEFKYEACVFTSLCLTFNILDSVGDGICCGNGDGEFIVKYDDVIVAQGGDFGDEYTSPSFGCSSSPTSSPTTAPVPCVDGGFPLSYGGISLPCAFVDNYVSDCVCSDPTVSSHCTNTCNSCAEYACVDSTASWESPVGTVRCADLSTELSPAQISRFCGSIDDLRTTCPATCGVCG